MEAQKAGGQQQSQQDFPTFCYTNVSTTTSSPIGLPTNLSYNSFQGTNTVNLAQLATTDDNKTCYITQPFGYANYALVNQFQNGIAGITTVDGRIQVVNKPMANTVSSISFKCDVCGAMFTQLGHLNQHKRLHTQDGSNGDNGVQTSGSGSVSQETITVVTSGGQSFLQGQSIISETGQTLGQIQIVNADQLEAHHQQHQDVTIVPNPMHHQNQQQQLAQHHGLTITTAPVPIVQQQQQQQQQMSVVTVVKQGNNKGYKCNQCGGPRRKSGKGGRCDGCVKTEQQQRGEWKGMF